MHLEVVVIRPSGRQNGFLLIDYQYHVGLASVLLPTILAMKCRKTAAENG